MRRAMKMCVKPPEMGLNVEYVGELFVIATKPPIILHYRICIRSNGVP